MKDIKPAIESIKTNLNYIHHQQVLLQGQTNKKNFRNLYKEDLRKARVAWEKERGENEQKKEKMQLTCDPSKVRYYNCQLDNTQKVKYFNYDYDLDTEKCQEKVEEKKETC